MGVLLKTLQSVCVNDVVLSMLSKIIPSIVAVGLLVTGCSDVLTEKPSNEQALAAVRALIDQGITIFSQSPIRIGSALVAKIKVHDCKLVNDQDGVVCNVAASTQEIPIIGGFSTEINLRFVKHEATWVAFLQ